MIFSHDRPCGMGACDWLGGEKGLHTELVGSPEIVIEIVSKSSEVKDTEWSGRPHISDAGIAEYWLIDAREGEDGHPVRHLRCRGKERVQYAARVPDGWSKSAVLGKSFRLTQSEGTDGNPEFTFEMR